MGNPLFLPGKLSATTLQDLARDSTYIPTFTTEGGGADPTLGTGGSVSADIHENGRLITIGFTVLFGTAGVATGSGIYLVGLPPGLPAAASWVERAVGQVNLRDNSAPVENFAICRLRTTTQIIMVQTNVAVADTVPWTWAANDSLRGSITYPIAA